MNLNIQKAIIFATKKHEKQKRKGTDIPYIVYPMEVMQILTDLDCKEIVIIAGILHDTLEDTDTQPKEIEEIFGNEVLEIVQSESEDKTKTWKERKQTTIDNLKSSSIDTKLVCFADKFSNIRSIYGDNLVIGNKVWDRFHAKKDDIEWYYRSIAEALENISSEYDFNKERIEKLYKEFKDTIDAVFSK